MTRVVHLRMMFTREWLLEISLGHPGSTRQLMLITVIGVVVMYVAYKKVTSSNPRSSHKPGNRELTPEQVKEKTERWSEEAAINPAYPSSQGLNDTSNESCGHPSVQESGSDESNDKQDNSSGGFSVDDEDLDYNWSSETDVSFDDIGGMPDLKDELRAEVIKPLENPEKAEELGVSAPNILFHGPPGTGKTYTAKALATELGLPFAQLSGADVQSKWINESATKVNTLFSEAETVAAKEGGAIVFLDELDSVLKNRSGGGSAHEEDNKVVNEFLNHLEDTKEHNIVFVGATNRLDTLDDAGIRSGRIDKKIHVGKPDKAGREAILHAQLADRKHEVPDSGVEKLAVATDGAVAADLELIVNRAAKQVLARDGNAIQWADMGDLHR